MIRIDHVRPADAHVTVAALQSLYHRAPAEAERLAEMLADPDYLLLLADVDGSTVGYLYGQVLGRLDGMRRLLIYDITVAPEHRRQGVGRALMAAAIAHGRDIGVAGCWLIADEDNLDARAFYEHLGGEQWPAVGFGWDLS